MLHLGVAQIRHIDYVRKVNARVTVLGTILCLIAAVTVPGQDNSGTYPAMPRFEVASVRPTLNAKDWALKWRGNAMRASWAIDISGNRVTIEGITIKGLINRAFGIDTRLINGPGWVLDGQETFAIKALMPVGSSKDQVPIMLQDLLKERFHFSYHLSSVDQPGYALVVSRSGPKLSPPGDLDLSACKQWADTLGGQDSGNLCRLSTESNGQITTTRILKNSAYGPSAVSITGGEWHEEYYRMTMPRLADYLSVCLSPVQSAGGVGPSAGPPVKVTDRTGIAGEWHVTLDSTRQDGLFMATVTTSLQKQGLRLEKAIFPVEMLVIDRIDRIPTGN